jgi:mono/diheme cytochrome c family protein
MSRGRSSRHPAFAWLGVSAAIVATIAGSVALLRSVRLEPLPSAAGAPSARARAAPSAPGVLARITAGGITAQRHLPAPSFALAAGESPDPRLAPGRFTAELEVTFHPGAVRRAAVGAEIVGGTLRIEREGEVILSASGAALPGRHLGEPQFLPGRLTTLTYSFEADGSGPAVLRALWRPELAGTAVALPAAGGGIFGDDAAAGMSIVQQLHCAACHRSGDAALQELLDESPAPRLGSIGARARPQWLRSWIAGPQTLKPGAAMPALLRPDAPGEDGPRVETRIEDLTHFLASLGGPFGAGPSHDPDLVETGRALYHEVGCFACHGPLDPSGSHRDLEPHGYTPLGPVAAKTTAAHLAAFLHDPLKLRPSGRMPAQRLSELESAAIASYLVARDGAAPSAVPFVGDPARAARGRELFATVGCAACHSMGPGHQEIAPALEAPPLESIAASMTGSVAPPAGCLADVPPPGTADYGLDPQRRRLVLSFLRSLDARRAPAPPQDRLAAALDRLQCLRCHQFHGAGGPDSSVLGLFRTAGEIDLGEEGRVPPDLGDAGWRLEPSELARVVEEGGSARPYMLVRMPAFGEAAAARLPALLAAAAGVVAGADLATPAPAAPADVTEAGRALVGSAGLNCIQCHSIAGRASTDLPGPDLADMPRRLRFAYFWSWMHDPKLLRPTTRMPSFFLEGRSGILEHFEGDADHQIAAMWTYLSQGEHMALPDGLPDPTRLVLEVEAEPIVFRTFMKEIGPRAVACGFPEQIHCAFDASSCSLRLVWRGRFLSAAGAWLARGGTETDPLQEPMWRGPGGAMFRGITFPTHEGSQTRSLSARFRGYRLDEARRPVFLYDLAAEGVVVGVAEQPLPVPGEGRTALLRRFDLVGPAGSVIEADLRGQGGAGEGIAPRSDGLCEITLGESGRGSFSLEIPW